MLIGTVQYGKGSLYGRAIFGTQSPKAKWRVPRQDGRPRVLWRFRHLLGEHWKFSSSYFCFLCDVKPRLPAEQGLFFLTCNVSKMDDKSASHRKSFQPWLALYLRSCACFAQCCLVLGDLNRKAVSPWDPCPHPSKEGVRAGIKVKLRKRSTWTKIKIEWVMWDLDRILTQVLLIHK